MQNPTRSSFLFLITLCGLILSHTATAGTFLIKDGTAQADIVISEQPARMARLAADELQDILFRVTGARLEIVTVPGPDLPVHIYVGRSPATDRMKIAVDELDSDAFRMVSGEDFLVLAGRDTNFVPLEPYPHAVFSAEEKERVTREWDAMTGEKWGVPGLNIPRQYSAALGIWHQDERGSLNAVYDFLRSLGCRWYFPGELGEILPALKSVPLPNVNKTVRPDFPVRYMYMYYNEYFLATEDELKWQLRLGLNCRPEYQSAHGLMVVHCRDEMKAAHPKYYALWQGKRQNERDRWGAPCLSSEGLFKEAVRYTRAMYDLRGMNVVSMGPSDSYGGLCQCKLCEGKNTPERGWEGRLSDYVWDFVNRVAEQTYKTHPDKKVSCVAYSSYQLPPENIGKLSPNVVAIICQSRAGFHDAGTRKRFENLTRSWLEKLPSGQISVYEYYLHGWLGRNDYDGVPVYYPHAIARNLRFLKGKSLGDYIEVFRSPRGDEDTRDIAYVSHLNIYTTARMYWDAEMDVDAMLDEYYEKFYGPAADEMKAFIEFAEAHWPEMVKKPEPIDRAMELLATAREAAGNTIYARRIEGVIDYLGPLKALRAKVAQGRANSPDALATEPEGKLVLDGRLDEPFWNDAPVYELKELATGEAPESPTTFRMVWTENALVFGIRCNDADMEHLAVTTKQNGDSNVFNDDTVELLLETQSHSYYQIAVNAAGAMVDVDRKNRIDTRWVSAVEARAARDDTGWCLEIKVPIAGRNADTIDPLNGLAGEKPTGTDPWYFNLCRQRVRETGNEHSAFSPTGKINFHLPLKFGKLMVR